jgi:flagellar M-ring protein FliF
MKAQLQQLFEQLSQANAGVKMVLAAGALAALGWMGFSGYQAKNPAFRQLYSQLAPNDSAAVQSALAGAGIRYEASQPPGPYVIHVEESKFYEAQNAVALSGALTTAESGIQVGGSSDVFLSAGERNQTMRKRDWQEMEKQLEALDFVVRANVTTSSPKTLLGRKPQPPTVAVMLQVLGSLEPSRLQSDMVAKLVRHRFDVPASNVVISDQQGRSVYDGTRSGEDGADGMGLFEHKTRYDESLVERTNAVIDRAFGDGLAYIVVNSEWELVETETVTQRYDPKGTIVSQKTSNTETPQGGSGPGAGGDSSFGSSGAPQNPAGEVPVATSTEETKTSLVGQETQLTRRRTPKLSRLSVSLWLDESLEPHRADLENNVKSAVGYDEARGDLFSSLMSPVASVPRDAEGNIVPTELPPPAEEPSAMMELLLEHGIEALAAVAFLLVLFKTLKGSAAQSAAASAASQADQDLAGIELLAKSQIEELVRTDPERVSTILSHWASEESAVRS